MRISSLNTGTTAYTFDNAAALANNRLDKLSNLYQLDLKQINKRDLSAVANEPTLEDALVYTRRAIDANRPLSSSAVVLENADGSLFKLDTSNANTKVNLVARGKSIELYVYNPADNATQQPSSVLKYTFDRAGKLSANTPVAELKPWEVSEAEIKTKRDLDGNGTDGNGLAIADRLGGKLAVRTGATSVDRAAARQEASAGIFKLEVLDQQLFVVGETLEKSKQINAAGKTLLNTEGTAAWKPDATYSTFRAVKSGNNWSVYASRTVNNEKEVTKFDFDSNLKLTSSSVLSAAQANAAEVSNKRDLNADGFFGAEVSKAIDRTGGLYEAKFQGATMYLAQTGINSDRTGANPISLKGKLLDSQGNAWSGPATGYTLSAVVASTVLDANATAGDITVFAKNASNAVLKYSFSTSGAGNEQRFNLDKASANGLNTTAIDLAAAEKAAKRDLNSDSTFGVGGITATDATGGLYKGSMLGTDFYMVGSGLKTASTGSLANDLSQALLAVDGSAWKVKEGYTVATVVQTATIGVNGASSNKYAVYAYKGDAAANPPVTVDKNDVLRYEFESDASGKNVRVTASDIKVTAQYLSEQEKTLARDLNKDDKLGANLTSTALDIQGGLYKASLFGQDYVVKGNPGQSVVDLSQAFLEDDGVTAWKPKAADNSTAISLVTGTFRLVMGDASPNSGDATIYVSTGSGASSKYLKFDFEEVLDGNNNVAGYKQIGNSTVLSAEEMAAAEKANNTQSVDLNGDGSYGVVLSEALDQRGGLFKGSLGDRTSIFFKDSPTRVVGSKIASEAEDFGTALRNDSGYWSIDTTGKTVKAYTDGNDYIVLVSDNADKTKITQYTFDTTDANKLTDEQDISLDDLVAAELNAAVNRDLNADGNVGVRVSTVVPDSQGGLFTVSAGGKDHLVVDSAASNIQDLSTALRNKDGTAWESPAGTTRLVIDQQGTDYKLYVQTASGVNEYTFGSDYKIKEAQTRTNLDGFSLADAEKAADGGNGRDINGDGVVGARISKTLKDTAGNFLYEAKLGNDTYTVVLPSALTGVTTDLTDKALRKADGTAWTAGAMTLVDAEVTVANGKVEKTILYMKDGAAGKRLTFGSDGKLLGTDAISDSAITQLSDSVKASYMTGDYVDRTGGLFKATVLGSDIYVVGTAGNNANAPADLSQALMIGAGSTATAWKPDTNYSVGGLVTNASGGYDVYTYNTTDKTDVKKSSWDSDLNFLGTVSVDAANLVDVESTQKRDINADSAFGFSIAAAGIQTTAVTTPGHKGVTAVNVGAGSMTFLVAGTNLTPGSALAPIGLKDALLNAQGTAAWTPDSGYKITSVDDRGTNRVVYAASTANGDYMKYEFSKTNGKLQEPGTRLTAIQMAALELDDPNDATDLADKDLTADGHVGLGSITSLRVTTNSYAQGKDTGLLKATIDTNEFLVYSPGWTSGDKIDLNAALLKADGTAWSVPADFQIQGIYENADDELEVYGYDTAASKNVMYRFAPGVDSAGSINGAYTLMPSGVAGAATGANTLADADLARTEYDTSTDLNADGAVGYKANITPDELETGGTQALGKASLGTSEIYFVTTAYVDALADTTGSEVGGGALYMDTTGSGDLVYWKPETSEDGISYTVKSVVQNGSSVEVWALRADANALTDTTKNGFVKYAFTQNADNKWVLDNAAFLTDVGAPLSYDQVIANESGVDSVITGSTADANYTGKDLNGDGVIGLKLEALVSSASGSNIYKTTVKMDDGNGAFADTDFYLVGSNLASGTAAQPLGLDAKYVLVDGQGSTAAWAPSGTVTDWKVLDPFTANDKGATHSLDDGGTTKYFYVSSTEAYFVS